MKKKWLLWFVLVLVLALPVPVAADGMEGGKVIFGGSYTLLAGETLQGDLVVFGGNATVEAGARLQGELAVMGGNVRVDGEVHGDVALLGGQLTLGEEAVILGDVAVIGGTVERAAGAQIRGQLVEGESIPLNLPSFSPAPVAIDVSAPWWLDVAWKLARAFVLAALALLATLFVERPLNRVRGAAVNQPVAAGGVGLLTLVLLPGAMLLLALTLILLPVALLLSVAIVAAALLGWLALGLETGERLAQTFHWRWPPAMQAAIGTLALSLVLDLLSLVPCVGWLPGVLVGSVALGATVLTRLGTEAYPAPSSVGGGTTALVTASATEDEIPSP